MALTDLCCDGGIGARPYGLVGDLHRQVPRVNERPRALHPARLEVALERLEVGVAEEAAVAHVCGLVGAVERLQRRRRLRRRLVLAVGPAGELERPRAGGRRRPLQRAQAAALVVERAQALVDHVEVDVALATASRLVQTRQVLVDALAEFPVVVDQRREAAVAALAILHLAACAHEVRTACRACNKHFAFH